MGPILNHQMEATAKAAAAEVVAVAGTDATYLDQRDASQAASLAPAAHEYWRWVLAAVLAVLAAEIYLAQRFGHYAG